MKKRVLALVLAAAMTLTSTSFTAFAEENSAVSNAADEVTSGSAVEVTSSSHLEALEDGVTYPNFTTAGNWQASVFGDVGTQVRIDGNGDQSAIQFDKDAQGNDVYAYNVTATSDNSVDLRMGVPSYSDPTVDTGATGVGKISSTNDGIVYYYQELDADADFTISGTAKINGYNVLGGNQVSFGIMAKDFVETNVHNTSQGDYGNDIVAGPIGFQKKVDDGSYSFSWFRNRELATKLVYTNENQLSSAELPAIGSSVDISLTKAGTNYVLKYGDEQTSLSAEDVELKGTDGKIYAGFFVARCADVTFSNIRLSVVGAAVETGDWTEGGQGYYGKKLTPIDPWTLTKTDDQTISIDVPEQGKLSSSEDGYVYYAISCPSTEDFDIQADVKVTLNAESNPQQGSAGLIAFNQKYVKEEEPYDDYITGKMDNSFMLGTLLNGSGATTGNFGTRKVSGFETGKATVTTDYTTFADVEGTSFPNAIGSVVGATLRLKRSGDNITAYVNGTKASYDISGIFTNDNCYVGIYATRNADIEVSNLEFVAGSRKIESIEITKMPNKVNYIVNEELDTTGMEVTAHYADGGSDVVDPDEIITRGFDSKTAGVNQLEVVVGAASTFINLNINKLKLTSLKAQYTPIKTDYYTGEKFNSAGIEVTASYEDGTTKTLTSSQYTLTMNGKTIDDETFFTKEDVGSNNVIISYVENPNHDSTGVTDSFKLNVEDATLDSISIILLPTNREFCVGDAFDTAGLTVQALYTFEDGSKSFQVLSSDEYTVEGFDSSKVNDNLTITVRSKADTTKTTTYTVTVTAINAVSTYINSYPRSTFNVDEDYTAEGLEMQIYYNNGTYVDMKNDPYIYFDGSNYYTADGPVTEAEAKAADYYIDLSSYDNSKEGETKVILHFADPAFADTTFTVAIQASSDYIWKPAIFGASSTGVAGVESSQSSYIKVNTTSGDSLLANDKVNTVGSQRMTNGNLDEVKDVQVVSWTGAGKVSGDQDGICYYYTRVNPQKNFQLSADITVNRYIRDPEETADFASVKKEYDSNIAAGDSAELALDKLRSGQECFGIMARDNLPLDAEVNGDMNNITINSANARKDENGEPINIYEAWLAGLDGVNNSNVSAIFASNIVIAGGCTMSTFPTDPTKSDYYTKYNMNRINIMVRTGVTNYAVSGGERVGILSTTDHLPVAGDRYKVTLTKMSTGYSITTYDYQTATTNTQYDFYTNLGVEDDLLSTLDKDNIWIGFFASRYADATISDIHLYETDPDYDPEISFMETDIYSPKITVESALYTTNTNYVLNLKSNNPTGGYVTIKQGDKIVYSNMSVSKKGSNYPITLEPNSTTEFAVVYSPSTVDNCVSYDDVVTRFTITCAAISNIVDDTLYTAPGAPISGQGTREDPIDFETAIQLMGEGSCYKVVMLDGVYNISQDNITLTQTQGGLKYRRKYLVADEGANPVIDLQNKKEGFYISADYWTIDGITVCNSMGNGKAFYLGGQYNTIKNCTFHDNGEVGFQISRVGSNDDKTTWPSYNLIENCESYNNCDPSKNNADGFAAKLTCGYGNVFKNCISHHNLDDGWDCYTKLSTGAIGAEVLEGCISYRQGYQLFEDGTEADWNATSGGNGFKIGGENIYVMHYLKDCLTYMNKAKGIDSNFNPAMKIRNVIAYSNEERNIGLYSGSSTALENAAGSNKDVNGNFYKFDYDIKGFVSAGDSRYVDQLSSVNYDTKYKNVSTTPILNETNYFAYAVDSSLSKPEETPKTGSYAVSYNDNDVTGADGVTTIKAGTALNPDEFFVSTNRYDSLNSLGRYDRDEDGAFIKGDFLARTTAFVHESGDEVELPNQEEQSNPNDSTSETTTVATDLTGSTGHSSSGGGGGSIKTTTTTTEATTEATTSDVEEVSTEATTKTTVTGSVTTPSGMVINPPADDKDVQFEDISSRPWAVDAINALAQAGVINGKSATIFAPDEYCKRADFILTVVNALGLEADYTENFSDVADGKYYADALGIAKALGIASGYSDGTFKPEDTITRQDMMILVAKIYEQVFGFGLEADTSVLDAFNDADEISDYAIPYVAKLVGANLVNGTDKGLEPKALITRAQMAVLVKPVYDEALTYVSEAIVDDTADVDEAETVEESTEETTETATVVNGRGKSKIRVTENTVASTTESEEDYTES
jgi:hypothetical protein